MRAPLFFALAALLLLAPAIASADETAQVLRVKDGDTIQVRMPDGRQEPVRYIGMDTPELDLSDADDSPAVRAYLVNRQLVGGKRVRLVRDVSDRDRYNRLLRYVYTESPGGDVGEVFVNAELVRLGHARPMSIAPNVKFKALFSRLRKAARKPCKDFVELMVKDLHRRARREERKSSEWAERFLRLDGRAMVKDLTPAECAAAVKAGLPDPKTLAEALEGLMKVLVDE